MDKIIYNVLKTLENNQKVACWIYEGDNNVKS